jgi:hypothetical protein
VSSEGSSFPLLRLGSIRWPESSFFLSSRLSCVLLSCSLGFGLLVAQ